MHALHPKKLGLYLEWNLTNFSHEQCALIGKFEPADTLGNGTCE
jgi:hypothetical protein